jgi:capsular polysaccharide biosynthesis protein
LKNRNRNARQNYAARSESVAGAGFSDPLLATPSGSVAPAYSATHSPRPAVSDDVWSAIGRHWKPVVAAAIAGMIVAWLFTALQPDRYRATLLAAVSPLGETLNATDVLRGVEVLEQRTVVATVAALAATPSTIPPATNTDTAGYTIDASVLPNTNLVRIHVEGPDAARATAIANGLPAVLTQHTRSMFKLYGVTPVSPATQPTEPVSSGSARTILAGLLIGLVIGAAIAISIDKSRRLSSAEIHA